MFKITRYYPSFMDGFPEEEHELSNLVDMYDIPFIKQSAGIDGFLGYDIDNGSLMVRTPKGSYVIANIKVIT